MMRLRRGKSRACGEQAGVLGRIDMIDPAGQHRDRAGGDAALMRRGIDAARQARDHHIAGMAKIGGHAMRDLAAVERRITPADQRDGGADQQGGIAQNTEQRGDFEDTQGFGECRVAGHQKRRPGPVKGCKLLFGGILRIERDLSLAAPPGEIGQGLKRLARRAETLNQAEDGRRADIFAATEAQPVEGIRRWDHCQSR
jgi:hypothetical protein